MPLKPTMDRLKPEVCSPPLDQWKKKGIQILANYPISERHIYGKKHTGNAEKSTKKSQCLFSRETKNMRESTFWPFFATILTIIIFFSCTYFLQFSRTVRIFHVPSLRFFSLEGLFSTGWRTRIFTDRFLVFTGRSVELCLAYSAVRVALLSIPVKSKLS